MSHACMPGCFLILKNRQWMSIDLNDIFLFQLKFEGFCHQKSAFFIIYGIILFQKEDMIQSTLVKFFLNLDERTKMVSVLLS